MIYNEFDRNGLEVFLKFFEVFADLVRKSHEARKEAKELLEEAKRKVEEAIESRFSLFTEEIEALK